MRNRTWAPVNMSQCIMDSGSPLIMIVVANLATANSTLVRSKKESIVQEVSSIQWEIFEGLNFQKYNFSNLVNLMIFITKHKVFGLIIIFKNFSIIQNFCKLYPSKVFHYALYTYVR